MARYSIIFNCSYTLEQIRSFASDNGLQIEAVVAETTSQEESRPETRTEITAGHLAVAANAAGKSVLEVAQLASSLGITTLEDALRHSEVPSNIKQALEELL